MLRSVHCRGRPPRQRITLSEVPAVQTEKPWPRVPPACLRHRGSCSPRSSRRPGVYAHACIKASSPSTKALVAQLASGLSSNKKVAFFPLHMPSRKAPLCKMRPSALGIRGGSVVFSTLHRLALVRLPQISVSLCCTFVTRHSRPPCTSTWVMSTNGYRGRYVPSQE